MRDGFGREIDYLRVSVTDQCNLRCAYCMPAEGCAGREPISFAEITEVVREAAALGVRKVRLTGGEPLLRPGLPGLCRELAGIPGVEELAVTTNGLLLPRMSGELKEAGVSRVNISLDTLDPEKYRRITRGGRLEDALAGVRAAWEAGLRPLKLNAVLIGGFNDGEIEALAGLTRESPVEVRFIELMPMLADSPLGPEAYLSCGSVLERLPELEEAGRCGTARLYRLPGAAGTVGLSSPLSCGFCGSCRRLRLTADGFLKPCLHSSEELSIRGLHGGALRARLREAASQKPARHRLLEGGPQAGRSMNQIGG